ncbi:MAG: UDP-N-acetylmuramoyl-L-alanyl-D-glutamate--2,6-diaminopimelate ligase [Planctomycetota bacterium]|nr:UDP-N-acetylmuramoyl-L-alanyl-D-glutamate--2,6-diaminopimelate ligase [Planctomycetota bacterium]MDI6787142.1 UDP-N-acetylmuramoyl-L-alanyl-D-glutamate--2,6-diaminopimelate ligase [Planctomycetota bacterium]
MELSELKPILLKLKGTRLYNFHNLEIKGISYNSKQVKEGNIFVAIPGARTDGNYFIPEALQRGALTIISNKRVKLFTPVPCIRVADPRIALSLISNHFFHHPSTTLKVIGVTGTNGKTTTTYLIRAILERAGTKAGLLGTIEYIIGERQIPAPVTTPESYDLQNYLSEMLKSGLQYAVMEVSSHSLALNRVLGINFHRAVFTNLARDHLDFHKTISRYKQVKGILFQNLAPDSIAILNLDDPVSKYYAQRTPAQVVWYHLAPSEVLAAHYQRSRPVCPDVYRGTGRQKPATTIIQAEIQKSSLEGNTILLKTPIGETTIHSPLIGRHNVYNILAASTTTVTLGIPVDTIKEGVETVKGIRGRLEKVEVHLPYTVMVDFAHTEDALRSVLRSLKPLVKGRIITVFGCGGDRDKGKRPLMGKIVSQYSRPFIITSDNPRSEDPLKIIKDIRKGIRQKSGYEVEPDRYKAIEKALALARKDDLVLIAGKGHETYQTFKDTVKPFDDREVVRQILQSY